MCCCFAEDSLAFLVIVVIFGVLAAATAFGQLWRLEPLSAEKKAMWQREMDCLLCVSDHIVELIPSWQTFSDGSKLEVIYVSNSDLINYSVICLLFI